MSSPESEAHGSVEPDIYAHRRAWRMFLQGAMWFALHVLGLVFFLILVLVGHWPVVPTLILVAAIVIFIGWLLSAMGRKESHNRL